MITVEQYGPDVKIVQENTVDGMYTMNSLVLDHAEAERLLESLGRFFSDHKELDQIDRSER